MAHELALPICHTYVGPRAAIAVRCTPCLDRSKGLVCACASTCNVWCRIERYGGGVNSGKRSRGPSSQAAQRALVVAKEKAANEAKSEFMSLMCHEVRTPLNGCLASAEMLLETSLQARPRPPSRSPVAMTSPCHLAVQGPAAAPRHLNKPVGQRVASRGWLMMMMMTLQ